MLSDCLKKGNGRKVLAVLTLCLAFLLAPSSSALEECQRQTPQSDVPCNILSTWQGDNGNCTPSTLRVYNDSAANVQNLTWEEFEPVCRAEFNLTELGTYHFNSSIETGAVTVVADVDVAGWLLMFFGLLTLAVFLLPAFARFVEDDIWNRFIGKMVWVFGLFLVTVDVTMAADIATKAGLGSIADLIFGTYHWLLVRSLYVVMLAVLFQAVVAVVQQMGERRQQKRAGEG